MKRSKILLILVLPLLLGSKPAKPHEEDANIYAVVVGVSNYKDTHLKNLDFAEADASAFYNVLCSPACGSIPRENIVLLTGQQATRANVIKEMISKFSRARDNDMIIFYFSGHGKGGEFEDNGYLLSYDTEVGNEGATALSMDDISSKMKHSQAKMKVSYIDACHAGLFQSDGKGLSTDENLAITNAYRAGVAMAGDGNVSFLASSARQESLEKTKLQHGVFTYYLLKGLEGDADRFNKTDPGYANGIVTIGELSAYLNNKVGFETNYQQTPAVYGTYDDNFPLSVVSPDVSITKEMGKMPVRRVKISPVNYAGAQGGPASGAIDMQDKKLEPDGTSSVFADYNFINHFKETLMITEIYAVGGSTCTTLIPPGQMVKTPKIGFGSIISDKIHVNLSEVRVYFQTIDDTKPILYGKLTLPVEPFVEKTLILSADNLYLSKGKAVMAEA